MPYKLVGSPLSTCTQRIMVIANEVGAELEINSPDFAKLEHKSEAYLANEHPFGKIPVLHDGNYKLFESRAIARYIADKSNNTNVYPRDTEVRGLVEQWISVETSYFSVAETIVGELVFAKWHGREPNMKIVEEKTKPLNDFLFAFNKQLEGKDYLVANKFTLADAVFLPYLNKLLGTEEFKNVLEPYANLQRWWNTISNRPSWKKTIAQ
eukprot:TRINITY_DN5247_c0_g1_i3.p1 TRINITY_DN5247_c0_g1~~TRINITY_DN5247_c0_g1_i3.p1  ORF type:complete len:210 (-),score=63.08 TRINITY_DN5247_c0_g1_i3:42-671(-)